jgi:hypothetical protein
MDSTTQLMMTSVDILMFVKIPVLYNFLVLNKACRIRQIFFLTHQYWGGYMQESFVSKQAAVFASLERLFSLHNSILLESRALKTFLFYVATSIFIYMSTSAKQTYNARPLLYCGMFFHTSRSFWSFSHKNLSLFYGNSLLLRICAYEVVMWSPPML